MGILINKANNRALSNVNNFYTNGAGLKFDGVNDFVEIPYTPTLDFEFSDDVSVSIWLKPFSNLVNANGGISRFIPSGSFTGLSFDIFNNFYSILILGQGNTLIKYVVFSGARTLETLRHLVFVKDGQNATNYKIYENGVLLATNVAANGAFTTSIKSNKPYFIGRDAGGGFLNTEIYDLKFFNKPLEQQEITELYQTKGMRIPATAINNVVADYRFNQKEGTILLYTQGNNGILNNFANTNVGAGNAWRDNLGNSILV